MLYIYKLDTLFHLNGGFTNPGNVYSCNNPVDLQSEYWVDARLAKRFP